MPQPIVQPSGRSETGPTEDIRVRIAQALVEVVVRQKQNPVHPVSQPRPSTSLIPAWLPWQNENEQRMFPDLVTKWSGSPAPLFPFGLTSEATPSKSGTFVMHDAVDNSAQTTPFAAPARGLSVLLNGGCVHVDHWKHLRSRRGYAYMICFHCGHKWRFQYATPSRNNKHRLHPQQQRLLGIQTPASNHHYN